MRACPTPASLHVYRTHSRSKYTRSRFGPAYPICDLDLCAISSQPRVRDHHVDTATTGHRPQLCIDTSRTRDTPTQRRQCPHPQRNDARGPSRRERMPFHPFLHLTIISGCYASKKRLESLATLRISWLACRHRSHERHTYPATGSSSCGRAQSFASRCGHCGALMCPNDQELGGTCPRKALAEIKIVARPSCQPGTHDG